MAASRLTPTAAAIVLTGGQSRRMGTDKASLVVDGVSLVERSLAALNSAHITHIVVAGSDDLPDPAVVGDTAGQTQGPLAGISSGWNELQRRALNSPSAQPPDLPDAVVVLSCDLPSISPEVITALVTASADHAHGALAHDGERPQPLIAAYRAAALDELVGAYARGERSVRRCFAGWDLGLVHFDAALLTDADTPADLDGFEVQWPTV